MMMRNSALQAACVGVAAMALTMAGCSGGAPPTPAGQGGAGGKTPTLQVYRGASDQFVENYNPLSLPPSSGTPTG